MKKIIVFILAALLCVQLGVCSAPPSSDTGLPSNPQEIYSKSSEES